MPLNNQFLNCKSLTGTCSISIYAYWFYIIFFSVAVIHFPKKSLKFLAFLICLLLFVQWHVVRRFGITIALKSNRIAGKRLKYVSYVFCDVNIQLCVLLLPNSQIFFYINILVGGFSSFLFLHEPMKLWNWINSRIKVFLPNLR